MAASEPLPLSPPLLGRHLDRPSRGPLEDELMIAGWALCADGPLARVLATAGTARPLHVPADRGRSDIAAAFPDLAHAERSGFRLRIAAAALAHVNEIVLAAELADGARVPIWRIALAAAGTAQEQSPDPRRRSRLKWARRREGASAPSPSPSSSPPPTPGRASASGSTSAPTAQTTPPTTPVPAAISRPAPDLLASSPRVVAIISAFNEADVIEPVLDHLASNGIGSYLIDNCSTDATVRRARRWLGRGLLGIERFENPAHGRTSWRALLARKLELARELGADWYIHHDADEIRESPWPGLSLCEAIGRVDRLGFNAIDFRVLNFLPVDDTFREGADPRRHFLRWEEPAEYDRIQRKCWQAQAAPDVTLADGGHDVRFAARRVFPLRFLLRHYPIRSQAHGRRKVFEERQGRFSEDELALGWHRQYEHVTTREHLFLRNPATLRPFDLDRIRLETVLQDGHAAALRDGELVEVGERTDAGERGDIEERTDGGMARSDQHAARAPAPAREARPAGAEQGRGFLDRVSPTTISGWAAHEDAGAGPARVELWDGGRVIATVTADEPRADLASQGIAGEGRAGFTVATPRELLDGRAHWIWATVAGTGVALRRSPLVLHVAGRVSPAATGGREPDR